MPPTPPALPFDKPYTPTLPNVLQDAAARFADREFIVMGERRVTFESAERESAELARGLT